MHKHGPKTPLTAVALALLLASTASAQGRVTGTVKDAGGRPIKGAIVSAENHDVAVKNLTTTSNAKGKYAFLGLRGGTWMFTAEAPGFGVSQRQMDVRNLGANASVDFQLEPASGAWSGPTSGIDSAAIQQRLEAAAELERAGKLDDAIGAYREILARLPALTRVHLQLGVLFERKHDTPNAIAEYQAVLKADPADAKARAALARLSRDKCPVPVVRDIIPGRGIPPRGVAPRSDTPGILARRAWRSGRRARDLCHDPLGWDTSHVRQRKGRGPGRGGDRDL